MSYLWYGADTTLCGKSHQESNNIGLYRDVWIAAIHNESGDPNGGNMCSFSGATCTSRVRHNADYVPYAKIRFDL